MLQGSLTGQFSILKPRSMNFSAVQKLNSVDFEAWKFGNVQSGVGRSNSIDRFGNSEKMRLCSNASEGS